MVSIDSTGRSKTLTEYAIRNVGIGDGHVAFSNGSQRSVFGSRRGSRGSSFTPNRHGHASAILSRFVADGPKANRPNWHIKFDDNVDA